MSREEQPVAVTVLWRGTNLIMEERWVDLEDGTQDTRYAFPGGKPESGETMREAAAREALEETGIAVDPEKLSKKPDIIHAAGCEGYVFNVPLEEFDSDTLDGSVVIWSRQDLMDYKAKGKLMPLTDKYVEDYF